MNVKHVYEGHEDFRWRLALALITFKTIKVRNIRSRTSTPGITKYEFSYLKLLETISNGTTVRINDTGTVVTFMPGTLIGGVHVHKCGLIRGIGYFLEPLLLLSMYCKEEMEITLKGVTNSNLDPSVDLISNTWIPIIKRFIGVAAASELKLQIIKRGLKPNGGGEVILNAKPTSKIFPINCINVAIIYKIRGVAWTANVNPGISTQMIKGAKSLLNKVLSDVYITIDHKRKDFAGKSPGYGICLWAESKDGAVVGAEYMSNPKSDSNSAAEAPVIPDDIGLTASGILFNQISSGGFVDSSFQSLVCAFMSLEGGRNASQIVFGTLTPYTIHNIRLIDDFVGVKFHFKYKSDYDNETADEKDDEDVPKDDNRLILTCFGSGLVNSNRMLL